MTRLAARPRANEPGRSRRASPGADLCTSGRFHRYEKGCSSRLPSAAFLGYCLGMRKTVAMRAALFVLSALLIGVAGARAQEAASQRAAHAAYEAEMAQASNACQEAVTLADRNDCFENIRAQTYKNSDAFYAGLREVLIDQSPNDANALALDDAQRAWEKGRTATCDAVSNAYDVGTVKHPGSAEPNARIRCLIEITRSRMRDLMQLYGPTL
jgi:uncharacterized protein YecT (DUF1311 family)